MTDYTREDDPDPEPDPDESRIDTIGRVIARPQDHDVTLNPLELVMGAVYKTVGLFGLGLLMAAGSVFTLWLAYDFFLHGGIVGWINAFFALFCAAVLSLLSVSYFVFWMMDDGETKTVLGMTFRN